MFNAKFFKAEVAESCADHLMQEFTGALAGGSSCEVRYVVGQKAVQLVVRGPHTPLRLFVVTVKEVL